MKTFKEFNKDKNRSANGRADRLNEDVSKEIKEINNKSFKNSDSDMKTSEMFLDENKHLNEKEILYFGQEMNLDNTFDYDETQGFSIEIEDTRGTSKLPTKKIIIHFQLVKENALTNENGEDMAVISIGKPAGLDDFGAYCLNQKSWEIFQKQIAKMKWNNFFK